MNNGPFNLILNNNVVSKLIFVMSKWNLNKIMRKRFFLKIEFLFHNKILFSKESIVYICSYQKFLQKIKNIQK